MSETTSAERQDGQSVPVIPEPSFSQILGAIQGRADGLNNLGLSRDAEVTREVKDFLLEEFGGPS